jgi:DNA-3-methyladenine glycosylase II
MFSMSEHDAIFAKARRHLSRKDEVLKRVVKLIGPCTLQINPNRFDILVRSIVSQQISGKAAESISARLEKALAPSGFRPAKILRTPEAKLRACGLSANKARFLLDLAGKVHDGSVPLARIHDLPDEEVIEALLPVKGIGRWTAQMFLIFSLGRWDVLPVDDLGLRVGVKRQFGLAEMPGRAELTELAEPWRPYRTIATWYLWRSLGAVPQSDAGDKGTSTAKQPATRKR